MHVCIYVCLSVRWWLASGVHANFAFHCVRAMTTWCVHVRMPYWVVPCNAWLMDGWMIVMNGNGDTWFVRSCERVMERRCRIEWMHASMDGLTVVCVCVCVCVCGWLVRVTCLQGGAVYIFSGQGTFTNCNFTSNSATGTYGVSLEEEHVDGCMWYVWVHDDAEVVPSIYVFLTDWLTDSFLLPLSVYCDCFLWSAIGLDVTPFSAPLLFFLFLFAFACTSAECKSFCYLSSHIFSWPSLPSDRSLMNPLSTSS